jgi:hypothetical protein
MTNGTKNGTTKELQMELQMERQMESPMESQTEQQMEKQRNYKLNFEILQWHRNIWTHTLHLLTLSLDSTMRQRVKFNHPGLLCCMCCGLGVIWFWQM